MSFFAKYPVTSGSGALPAGAATSALQVAGNASLASIDSKTLTAGQKTMANSYPVVIASDQSAIPVTVASVPLPTGAATSANQVTELASLASIDSKLTSPLAVTGTFFQATQPISAASLPLPSGASTSANQVTELASLASIDSKLTSPLAVSQSGSWTVSLSGTSPVSGTVTANQGTAGAQKWLVDGSGVTQPVSGTFFQATQPVSIAASVAVTGPLTDTQLRASAVPVSLTSTTITGSVSVTQGTSPWVDNVSQINGVAPLMGNGVTGTGSQRVTIASDNTAFTVNAAQSGTWNINNVSGTISLPTGAATEATLAKLPLAQGSTTSGQSGVLEQGAVTTAAPSYTTGQTSPLSLTTAGALRVDASATTQPISIAGTVTTTQGAFAKANAPARLDYTSTSVTTAAYVQIIASTTSAAKLVEIFDSSGQTLVFAVGAAAAEVDQFNITPGGNGQIPIAIPAGSRVSIKAVSATASVGEFDLNLYG